MSRVYTETPRTTPAFGKCGPIQTTGAGELRGVGAGAGAGLGGGQAQGAVGMTGRPGPRVRREHRVAGAVPVS